MVYWNLHISYFIWTHYHLSIVIFSEINAIIKNVLRIKPNKNYTAHSYATAQQLGIPGLKVYSVGYFNVVCDTI